MLKSIYQEIESKVNGIVFCLLLTKRGKLLTAGINPNIFIYKFNENQFKYENCLYKVHAQYTRNLIEVKENFVLSSGGDSYLKLWNIQYFQITTIINLQENYISKIIKSKEEKIISCGSNGLIRIFDKYSCCIHTFKGHKENISCIIEIKDNILASSGGDNTLRFWDLKHCTNKNEIIKLTKCFANNSLFYIENKNLLLVGAFNGLLSIINLEIYKIIKIIKISNYGIFCFTKLPNNDYLIGINENNSPLIKLSNGFNSVEKVNYPFPHAVVIITSFGENRILIGDYYNKITLFEYKI